MNAIEFQVSTPTFAFAGTMDARPAFHGTTARYVRTEISHFSYPDQNDDPWT